MTTTQQSSLAISLLVLLSFRGFSEDAVDILKRVEKKYRSVEAGEIETKHQPAKGPATHTRLVWHGKRWRVENDTTDGVALHAMDGETHWQYHAGKHEYSLGEPETIEAAGQEQECLVVRATYKPRHGRDGSRITWWIDSDDYLIWRVRSEIIPPGEGKPLKLRHEVLTVSTNFDSPASDDLFAFRVPSGATRVERFRKGGDPPQDVVDVLARVERAYRDLERFHFEWTEVSTHEYENNSHIDRKRNTASAETRNRWVWTEGRGRFGMTQIRNGEQLWTYYPRIKQYTVKEGRGWPIPHPLGQFEHVGRNIEEARLLGTETVVVGDDWVECRVLELQRKRSPGDTDVLKTQLWIDRDTDLVRKSVETFERERNGERNQNRTERLFEIARVGSYPNGVRFEFAPPDDARKVDEFDFDVARDGESKYERVGQPAPDFELTGLDGKQFRLSDVIDKPVLLYFWTTWCGPCKDVGPMVEMLHRGLESEGLVVASVNTSEEAEDVRTYLKKSGYTMPTLLDDGTVGKTKLGVNGFPTILLIGADRKIRVVNTGFPAPMRQLHKALRDEGVW